MRTISVLFTSLQVHYYYLNVKYIKNHPTDHTVVALEASTHVKKCEPELAPLYFYYKLSLSYLLFLWHLIELSISIYSTKEFCICVVRYRFSQQFQMSHNVVILQLMSPTHSSFYTISFPNL